MVTCRGLKNEWISESTVEDHLASDEPKNQFTLYSLRSHVKFISEFKIKKEFEALILVSERNQRPSDVINVINKTCNWNKLPLGGLKRYFMK